MHDLAKHFLLDPEVHFLNHGSFGATPRRVLERCRAWQTEAENQPVHFFATRAILLLEEARRLLGNTLGARGEDLVFVPNATFGVNVIARSLKFQPGDEILATTHEYGACDNAWMYACSASGAVYRKADIPIPFASEEELLLRVVEAVSPKTRMIFISHITSPTAIRFPVEKICRWASERGITTLVDGAHAPGQIPLDLGAIGADFYTGNCHKWMLSPKGAGFLYARPEVQRLVEPLVVSWGWGEHPDLRTGSTFIDNLQWLGTNDISAYLSVPEAIQFMADHDWNRVRRTCRRLLVDALDRISALTGLPDIYPNNTDFFVQMAAAELPRLADLRAVKKKLLDDYHIEVPLVEWGGRHFIRVSVQGYNTPDDIDALVAALAELLPGSTA